MNVILKEIARDLISKNLFNFSFLFNDFNYFENLINVIKQLHRSNVKKNYFVTIYNIFTKTTQKNM